MAGIDLVRFWKDPAYRSTLSNRQRAELPANPAGLIELTDAELKEASGVAGVIVTTFKTCTDFTYRRFQCCH
jgi:mersacidin/lichenicidin family type 2 lantibiotic